MESPEKAEPSKDLPHSPSFRPLMAILALPVLVAGGIGTWWCLSATGQRPEFAAVPTFSGRFDNLKQTLVVPTLDSPLPGNRNVIWCSSFQLTWNEIRANVVGAPLKVVGAATLAARLNAAKQSISDLDPDSVYATGGWIHDGIIPRIRTNMAAKFPSHRLPEFGSYEDGILAYSYLTANVPFTCPFRPMDQGFTFTDSQGVQTQVAGFGLWGVYARPGEAMCDQVEILYLRPKEPRDPRHPEELAEYALDLCRHSQPYQVVVARVELKGTLAEMVEHIRTQIADFKRLPDYEDLRGLHILDELAVPDMIWKIDCRFKNLIGRTVANVKMPIVEAVQTIELRLDRSGVALESESMTTTVTARGGTRFEFNRPFLVYVQKRGAEQPFFVMWVDNAELLVRR